MPRLKTQPLSAIPKMPKSNTLEGYLAHHVWLAASAYNSNCPEAKRHLAGMARRYLGKYHEAKEIAERGLI